MKTIDIIGENYFGKWMNTRIACRGIIIKDSKILLSYETVTDQWMIPGGGLEDGEDEKDCCIREVAEETGILIRPSECLLEIAEYYKDWKWINRYFVGEIVGHTDIRLTEREKEIGAESRWLSVEEIIDIFSKYRMYAKTDERKRDIYLREYTALRDLIKNQIIKL